MSSISHSENLVKGAKKYKSPEQRKYHSDYLSSGDSMDGYTEIDLAEAKEKALRSASYMTYLMYCEIEKGER